MGADQNDGKEQSRIEAIKSFSLTQIATAPALFKHALDERHVTLCFEVLVPIAFGYSSGTDLEISANLRTLAQYKTFSLLEMLQKIRLGKNKKGFADEKCEILWLLLINQRVNKVLQGNEVTKILSDHQKRILNFLTKEVTPTR